MRLDEVKNMKHIEHRINELIDEIVEKLHELAKNDD